MQRFMMSGLLEVEEKQKKVENGLDNKWLSFNREGHYQWNIRYSLVDKEKAREDRQ